MTSPVLLHLRGYVTRWLSFEPSSEDLALLAARVPAESPFAARIRRVWMLVEVVDQNEETVLVRKKLEELGWVAREATAADIPPTSERRKALVVEARVQGARFGAVRGAVNRAERLAEQAELGMWVRDAALVEHPRGARKTYQVHRVSTASTRMGKWFAEHLLKTGAYDEDRVTVVPAETPDAVLRGELTRRPAGDSRFDLSLHDLRRVKSDDVRVKTPRDRWVRRKSVPWYTFAAVCGAAAVLLPGWLRLIPFLIGAVSAVPLSRLGPPAEGRNRRAPQGALLYYVAFFCGFFSFALLAIVLTKEPLAFLAFIAFAAVALVLVAGLPLAFSGVGRSQHTAWLVPLSIPLGWTVVVWLGRLRHERYLSQFGIPGDAVPVANRSIYLAGLLPMAVPLGLALFTVAVDALLRHLHRVTHGGPFRLAEALLVFVAVLALTGFSDTYGAGTAARHAKSAAAAGHTPAPYYGLQATLVCVQPVSAAGRIPIANGPLPTGHPVVFFDASEDWIHLWDPARREARNAQQSITVRREDVQLMLTQRGKCP